MPIAPALGYLAPVIPRVPLIVGALAVVAGTVIAVAAPTPAEAAPLATLSCVEPPVATSPPDVELESYRAINPRRLVDTRDATGGVGTPLGAGCTIELTIGSDLAPANAQAIALSTTAVSDRRGYFTVFPCATGRPETSNVNARAGIPTPNLVVARLDAQRRVCIYSQTGGDLVIDLAGWWSPGPDRYNSIVPARAWDSRVDGTRVRLPAGAIQNVPIGGKVVPADATAAVINFTATQAVTPGWLVVFPCGSPAPLASNLNVIAVEDRAVAAIVGLGEGGAAEGQVCVKALMDTHFVIDVTGYYAPAPAFGPAATFRPLDGDRLIDSRDGTGGWTTPIGAGELRSFAPVAGRVDAAEATAVVLNVVSTNGVGSGNVRIFPCAGGSVTPTSSLNFSPGVETTNLVNVELGADGTVCVFSTALTDLVIDLFGVVTAPAGSLVEQLRFDGSYVYPEFGIDDVDYAVECPVQGTNQLSLHLDLLPGVTARVRGVPVGSGDFRLAVRDDSSIEVVLRRDSTTKRYLFRCLPFDFPKLTVTTPGTPRPGWILSTLPVGSTASYAVIFDERGAPVWYKRSTEALINLQSVRNGELAASRQPRAQFFGTPDDDLSHWIFGLDGEVTDALRSDDQLASPVDHHEFIDGPGDGWTIISYPYRENVDTTGMPTVPGPFGSPGGRPGDRVVDGEIVEINADGVSSGWSWNSKDHFSPAETTFPQRFNRYPLAGEPGEVDLIHINSTQRLPDGDYLVSGRHLDAVFRVNRDPGQRDDGKVQWILGSLPSDSAAPGYVANLSGATRLRIIGDPWGGPRRQHDARFDESTKILTVYDNRTAMVGQSARVVAYRIDETAGTATMIREIKQPAGFVSPALGSARFASDGAVLVNWGQLQPMFTELDAAGDTLLSITSSVGTFRAIKVDPSIFSIDQLRANTGGSLTEP